MSPALSQVMFIGSAVITIAFVHAALAWWTQR